MRFVQNTGNDRVVDLLRDWLVPGTAIDVMSPAFSIFAYAEVRELLESASCRLLLGVPDGVKASLFGGSADIASRGKLQGRWLAKLAADWINAHSEVRYSSSTPPQSLISVVAANRRRSQPVNDHLLKSGRSFVAFGVDPCFPTLILIFQLFGKVFHPLMLLIIAIVLKFYAVNKFLLFISRQPTEVFDKRIVILNFIYNIFWRCEPIYRNLVEKLAVNLWFLEITFCDSSVFIDVKEKKLIRLLIASVVLSGSHSLYRCRFTVSHGFSPPAYYLQRKVYRYPFTISF
jgi:hypothetical protein